MSLNIVSLNIMSLNIEAVTTVAGADVADVTVADVTVAEVTVAEPRTCCDDCAKCVYCRAVDTIEIGCLSEDSGRICLYTRGLWQFGAPELSLRPPEAASRYEPELIVFLTTGLLRAARQLTVAEGLTLPLSPAWYRGRPVTFRLGRLEPPSTALSQALAGEVDSVLRLSCSLWESRA